MPDNILPNGESVSPLLVKSIVSTVKAYHVNRAIEFFDKNNLYWGFGHPKDWEASKVPIPKYFDVLEEPWGYKRVQTKQLVVPVKDDATGASIIEFQNRKFKIIGRSDAHKESCRWVYIMSNVLAGELPLKPFAQVSVQVGLKPKTGITKDALLPSDVQDLGYTEILNNRSITSRDADLKIQIAVILEF